MNILSKRSAEMILLAGFLLAGCAPQSSENRTPLEEAMDTFADGDYAMALIAFEGLIETQGSTARTGAAWCQLRLGDYLSAYSQFALTAADSLPDAYAGWAIVSWALNSPDGAIARADVVLTRQPQFIFSMDNRITASDLIWIQAASYYQVGKYSSSLERIRQLDSSFNPSLSDPDIARLLAEKLQMLGAVHF
ncbi:MAG: hypothetical protein KDC45_04660 [Bacteroidetes bacterium]|nr:hypothetical protein [Bacteroidota bacterium]